jgi:hypothetical protein
MFERAGPAPLHDSPFRKVRDDASYICFDDNLIPLISEHGFSLPPEL